MLLVLDDTTEFPIVFLGAQRIGAVPVSVSVLDKADNFVHYIEDSYAELVVTDADCLERLRAAFGERRLRYLVRGVEDADVVELDQGLAAQGDELEPAPTHRDDMAFWLYSSGSTGKPKGVVHLHHDIQVTCETYGQQVLGLRDDDVTFSTTKLFHAYGLGNGLSFPLWAGATSVLMRGPTRPEPILETLRNRRPTVFFSVPGAVRRALSNTGYRGRVQIRAPLRVGRRGAATAGVRAVQGARGARDPGRDRVDRDAPHLLLKPARRRDSRHHRPRRCPATSCGWSTNTATCSRARRPAGSR